MASYTEEDFDADPDSETPCPFDLNINTTVTVTGDSNHITIDPSGSAQSIAVVIISALKQASMGGSGVPMIDENGRPRTVRVKVEAGVRVEGQKNVVGEVRVVAQGQGQHGGRTVVLHHQPQGRGAQGPGPVLQPQSMKRKVEGEGDGNGEQAKREGGGQGQPVETEAKRVRKG